MIIGLTGKNSAGKGNLVRVFEEEGFAHFSVREFLKEEIDRRGEVPGDNLRDRLIFMGNLLREENGPSYIAEELYMRAEKDGRNAVIESLRCPGEIGALRDLDREDFYLVGVDAPVEERYKRAVEKGFEEEFEEFVCQEEKELHSNNPNRQNLSLCLYMADYLFFSDHKDAEISREEFKSGKEGFMNLFGRRRRPSFHEQYMRSAIEASFRSTCLRRKTGAVVALEGDLLTSGYNGAPAGLEHCEEVGCIREQEGIPSGERHEVCRGAHAEQNAISQASKMGIKIGGATMYATNQPCAFCAKEIINSGISRLIILNPYPDPIGNSLLKESDVEVKQYSGVNPNAYPKFWG
jgi:dCMP deaminase